MDNKGSVTVYNISLGIASFLLIFLIYLLSNSLGSLSSNVNENKQRIAVLETQYSVIQKNQEKMLEKQDKTNELLLDHIDKDTKK